MRTYLQNPDPTAAEYFASFVSKAYAALTDEVSRANYEKFGHPDGPQVLAKYFVFVLMCRRCSAQTLIYKLRQIECLEGFAGQILCVFEFARRNLES